MGRARTNAQRGRGKAAPANARPDPKSPSGSGPDRYDGRSHGKAERPTTTPAVSPDIATARIQPKP
jgi:hypothetical protein